jgi:hypothetical protein
MKEELGHPEKTEGIHFRLSYGEPEKKALELGNGKL